MSRETGKELGVTCVCGVRLVEDDDIESRQLAAMLPERLANDPFQSVSPGSELTVFLADCESEPGFVRVVWSVEHCKHVIATAPGIFEDAAEGLLVEQTVFPPEAKLRVAADCGLTFRDE